MEFHGHQVTLLVAHTVCGHAYIQHQTGQHGNVYFSAISPVMNQRAYYVCHPGNM